MNSVFTFLITALGLLAGMLGLLHIGWIIGTKQRNKHPDGIRGTGPIEGAIFGLMGLLLAFTFSGAGDRFERRRALIVEEANAIGTAYLRLALLPKDAQLPLQEKFRNYLENRISFYRVILDPEQRARQAGITAGLQREIWDTAISAAKRETNAATLTLIATALNQMIDITATRAEAQQAHPPGAVYAMLVVLLLCSALIAGFELSAGKRRAWLHMFTFAAILAITVYVILDYEYPRIGILRIDAADGMLVDVLKLMK